MAMDKDLIRKRFSKASATYNREASAQKDIAGEMCALLEHIASRKDFSEVLEIGCGTGVYTGMIKSRFNPDKLYINDICPEMEDIAKQVASDAVFISGDAETTDFPERLTLITSCSSIQWFSDLKVFFEKCRNSLTDNGILAFSTFGERNLHEIKSLTGIGLSYYSARELEKMLEGCGFEIILLKQDYISLRFPSPLDIIRHLKNTGATGIMKSRWTKTSLDGFCMKYERTYGKGDGAVPLTYHPIFIICKKNE